MPEILVVAVRSAVAFFFLLLLTRLMGKTEISQLTYFDYIVGITIGSIAANMSTDTSQMTVAAAVGVLVWAVLKIGTELVTLKSIPARKLLEGEPVVVIKNGKIMEHAMARAFYNVDELMIQLRNKKVYDISQVEEAILEPNGILSVIKKSQYQSVTPKDLGIDTPYKGMPQVLVVDGNIAHSRLAEVGLDEEWLRNQLRNLGINDISEVLVAQLNTLGELYVDKKSDWEGWK